MRRNKRRTVLWAILASFCLMLTTSCHEEDTFVSGPVSENKWIRLSDTEFSLSTKAQYRTIKVTLLQDGLHIAMESNASWLQILTDTIPADGYVEFFIEADRKGTERKAVIKFNTTDGESTCTAECTVTQGADDGSNYSSDAIKTMRVGCGYNIFGPFQNDASVMDPIISEVYLDKMNDAKHLVETNSMNELKVEKITARNLVEMAELLTRHEEKVKSGVSGSSKTVKIFNSSSYSSQEEQYAYIRMLKTVSMRSLDMGMLNMLIESGEEMFDDKFKALRNEIIQSPTDDNINEMLNRFGTHLVVQAELGASLELAVNFSQQITGTLAMRTEDFADYFFRGTTSSFLLDGKIEGMTSDVIIDKNCIITGGSKDSRNLLVEDITQHGTPSQSTLNTWLNSSSGDITSDAVVTALTPINFQLIPIWNLFPVSCASPIIRAVDQRSQLSCNQVTDRKTGTDYYKIELTNEMLSFKSDIDDTQVRVLYVQNGNSGELSPVLEICNEYVPNIRGDKRIPVIYGIKNGSPFLGAGFFPGDGEGNPPAWLTFSNGTTYVLPIEGFDSNERLTSVYYLHGRIYEKNYGIEVSVPKKTKWEDQYLTLENKYPIVKIGSGYWTRKNIREAMYFGEPIDPDDEYSDYFIYEELHDGMLYANIFYGNSNDLMFYHGNVYGPDENTAYGERTKWYLPKQENVNDLKQYIGNNTKAMMKNQPSGFEAEFAGLYGNWDELKNEPLPEYGMHYVNDYCFIPCKDDTYSPSGLALVLSKDYVLTASPIKQSTENRYPIRLYRTAYWKYVNINN